MDEGAEESFVDILALKISGMVHGKVEILVNTLIILDDFKL